MIRNTGYKIGTIFFSKYNELCLHFIFENIIHTIFGFMYDLAVLSYIYYDFSY